MSSQLHKRAIVSTCKGVLIKTVSLWSMKMNLLHRGGLYKEPEECIFYIYIYIKDHIYMIFYIYIYDTFYWFLIYIHICTYIYIYVCMYMYAATAPKSLQLCLTLCNPIDSSPPGSPIPGILQARTLEWVAISFSNALKWNVKVKLLSCVRLLATTWTAAFQAPPSMGCARQEYWSGMPLPSPIVSNKCYLLLLLIY